MSTSYHPPIVKLAVTLHLFWIDCQSHLELRLVLIIVTSGTCSEANFYGSNFISFIIRYQLLYSIMESIFSHGENEFERWFIHLYSCVYLFMTISVN